LSLSSHLAHTAARPAALLGAASLVLGSALLTAPIAYAAPHDGGKNAVGAATATSAKVDLQVTLLNSIKVPVHAALNDVSAPGDADKALLTADVNGMHNGKSVPLIHAEVAHSVAKANEERATGAVKIVGLRVYSPGLPLKPFLKADLLKANADCVKGKKPTASAKLVDIKVGDTLLKVESLKSGKPQTIEVSGVGTVTLAIDKVTITDNTAAATALQLDYNIDPGKLGVVKSSGKVILAKATCKTPGAPDDGGTGGSTGGSDGGGSSSGGTGGDTGGSDDGGSDDGATPQGGHDGPELAETGASTSTAVIGGIGAAAVVAGGGAFFLVRRRKAAQGG
jgi:LPXTG-motif cell wall-anchored protein